MQRLSDMSALIFYGLYFLEIVSHFVMCFNQKLFNVNIALNKLNPQRSYLEGYPAADMRTVSRTPQARNCWTARLGFKVNGSLASFGLMQRT